MSGRFCAYAVVSLVLGLLLAACGGSGGSSSGNVISPPTILSSTLPQASVSAAYSATLTASGGKTPYTWSLAQGSLPSGLSLNGATGVISGTPTASGMSSFTVQVRDSQSESGDRTSAPGYYGTESAGGEHD